MTKDQVKFYVTEEERKRLEILANLRFMTVPTYAKLTALGVKIQQVKEIYTTPEKITYSHPEERIITGDSIILQKEDTDLLSELLQRSTQKGVIEYDATFNEQLQEMAERLLRK